MSIAAVQPYGPNALQILFSDDHRRGVFPFARLRELCEGACADPAPAAVGAA